MSNEAALLRLAARQHGAIHRSQALAAGVSSSTIGRRRAEGRWRTAAPGVYVVGGSPPTQLQRWWVIVLSLGERAVLSHESAARRHGLPGIPAGVEAVTLPHHDHRRRDGVAVHQQLLSPPDLAIVDGLAFTTLPRTVCDLAGVMSTARLRHVVDAAQFELGLPIALLAATFGRLGLIGRPGAGRLVTVLDERCSVDDLAHSRLERLLGHVLVLAGLGPGIAQYPLPGAGRRSGLVDRAFPRAHLLVEADGRTWHARQQAMVADRQRDVEAAREGWITLRFMHEQLVTDPEDVARSIAEVHARRLAA